jgi:hypothetical protein
MNEFSKGFSGDSLDDDMEQTEVTLRVDQCKWNGLTAGR